MQETEAKLSELRQQLQEKTLESDKLLGDLVSLKRAHSEAASSHAAELSALQTKHLCQLTQVSEQQAGQLQHLQQ